VKPSDLIDPDLIENNKTKSSEDLVGELESVFINTAELLSPSIDYYSVFSGGIDSSLSSYFMEKINPPKAFISLQFPGKDETNIDMKDFEKKMGRKITTLRVDQDMFSKFFPECYKAACGPLSTHSFVSQAIMSHYVKNDNVKVLIGGDGADELFGGYEFYKTFDNNIKSYPEVNPSAYSGFMPLDVEFENWNTENLQNNIKDKWLEHSQYYSFEKDPYEQMLQTVLYSDTVIQLESVGIRAADTMSMVNSVESRSFFLSYDMIKFALNLPAKYKIDLTNNNPLMSTKPLLKGLYSKIFGEELIFRKQGFSGYPNEAAEIQLTNKDFNLLKNLLGISFYKESSNNFSQALEWKLMNVELFLIKYLEFV
jgi:asparagine synthase (glutamine-hydrolysing)